MFCEMKPMRAFISRLHNSVPVWAYGRNAETGFGQLRFCKFWRRVGQGGVWKWNGLVLGVGGHCLGN